jgi:DNA-binding NarL/FixJ family response regulator
MIYQVLLVEPNQLLREGLRAMLNAQPDFKVSAEAGDAPAAIAAATAQQPDLVLTEIALPGGLGAMEAIADIRRACPQTTVVVLTHLQTPNHVREALTVGATGFLVKDTSFDQVLTALRNAVRGRTYLSPEVSGHVVRQYLNPNGATQAPSALDQLSRRERAVMRLVAEGHTNRGTATLLHLSPKTVEKHRASLMRKLGLRSVAELAVLAVDTQLIERSSSVQRASEGLSPPTRAGLVPGG